jgi:hypothetical protein
MIARLTVRMLSSPPLSLVTAIEPTRLIVFATLAKSHTPVENIDGVILRQIRLTLGGDCVRLKLMLPE